MTTIQNVFHTITLSVAFTTLVSTSVQAARPAGDGCTPLDNQIIVSPTGSCTSIEAALVEAPGTAESPVVINVMPGTYTIPSAAPIVMKSYVTLRGAGREVTTLSSFDVIMEMDYVTNSSISGFTFTQAGGAPTGWGILGSNLTNVTIANNTFTGQHIGIYLYYVNNLTIEGNNIGASGSGGTPFGVNIDGGEPIRIVNNAFIEPNATAPGMTAISVQYSTDTTIEGNTITDSNVGIELNSAGSNNGVFTVSGNTIKGASSNGMFVGQRVDAMIAGNSISGASTGIWLDSTTATVTGNTITGSIVDGIESRARGGAGSPEIQGNVIKGNGQYGINVQFDSDPTISHNKITGNGSSDISVYNSTSTTPHISWNVFDTISGGVDGFGNYNLNSDGTDALVP